MRSHIDWNEIVPKLAIGLQQTLYLEAVRLISATAPVKSYGGRGPKREYKTTQKERDYQAEYYRRRKRESDKDRKPLGPNDPVTAHRKRKWTPKMQKKVLALYKEHGAKAVREKYAVTHSMIHRWKEKLNGEARPT